MEQDCQLQTLSSLERIKILFSDLHVTVYESLNFLNV